MKKISVYLRKDQIKNLTKLAKKTKRNKASILREAINQHLESQHDSTLQNEAYAGEE